MPHCKAKQKIKIEKFLQHFHSQRTSPNPTPPIDLVIIARCHTICGNCKLVREHLSYYMCGDNLYQVPFSTTIGLFFRLRLSIRRGHDHVDGEAVVMQRFDLKTMLKDVKEFRVIYTAVMLQCEAPLHGKDTIKQALGVNGETFYWPQDLEAKIVYTETRDPQKQKSIIFFFNHQFNSFFYNPYTSKILSVLIIYLYVVILFVSLFE